MDPDKMLEELQTKETEIRAELIDLEKQFNVKKEQYLKIQGALEALSLVGDNNQEEG